MFSDNVMLCEQVRPYGLYDNSLDPESNPDGGSMITEPPNHLLTGLKILGS